MPHRNQGPGHIPTGIILLWTVLILAILIGGFLFYQSEEEQARASAASGLSSIAALKVSEISDWRHDRLSDARQIMASSYLIDGIDTWIEQPNPADEERIWQRLVELNGSRHYSGVYLTDPEGNVRISLDPGQDETSPNALIAIHSSFITGEPILTDFYKNERTGKPSMDLVVPLIKTTGGMNRPVGAIVLGIDPDEYLYPYLGEWPVPSSTAETLLVERKEDNVLFLSNLRHMEVSTALNLTIPLTRTDVPAVKAVMGKTGAFTGLDYRDVQVISVVMPIEGTPWYMVSKVDTSEALASWNSRSALIIAGVAGSLIIVFFLIGIISQRRLKYYYRALFDSEVALRKEEERTAEILKASEEKLQNVVDSLPDAMVYSIRTGPGGVRKFEFIAGEIERLHGCTAEEALADANRVYDTFIDEERPVISEKEESAIHARKQFAEVMRLKTADGSKRWVYAASKPRSPLPDGLVVYDGVELEITDQKLAEEQIRQNEERLRLFVMHAPAAIAMFDRNMRYIAASRRWMTDFGLGGQDITGRSHYEVLPEIPESIRAVHRRGLAGEAISENESRFVRQDGSVQWLAWEMRPWYTVQNTVGGIIIFSEDITPRKTIEDEIRSAIVFLDRIIDMSPFALWVSDREGTIIRVNRALCEAIGLRQEEILGKYNVFRDKNLETQGVMREIEAVFRHHATARFSIPWKAADAGSPDFDRARDMFIDVSMFPILDAQGNLTSVVCQWVDITEQKATESLLRESEGKYRDLFTSMNEGSALHEMIYDAAGTPSDYRIIDANPSFERILGVRRADILGKTTRDAYGIDDPPFLETYARVVKTGMPEIFESYYGPMKRYFSISAFSPVPGKFATIFEDITLRKQTEAQRETLIRELEQKNAELERFTYSVSHDLKSPLITIKGFAGLLEDDIQKSDPTCFKNDVQRIVNAAETMQQLLSDVLELSRVGRVVSPPKKTSFRQIVQEAVELLAGPLSDRKVSVEIAPDLPEVYVDHARIREAMVNLIENSIKFSGNRPDPVIRIGMEGSPAEPIFFVRDNGIGIEPRYLDRIFNLFEKLDPSIPGTGIGLPIVKRIIEVHGGRIWADSEGENKGTTIRFTLPVPGPVFTQNNNTS
jgi:PAS domain S-box-containing protein